MRGLCLVALLAIAVAFADAQGFSDRKREFLERGKSDFIGKREEVNVNNELLCYVCSELMVYSKAYAHQSKDELQHTLEGLCKSLFVKHETEELMCETIVKEEMPTIFKYIDTELSPDGICRVLNMCT